MKDALIKSPWWVEWRGGRKSLERWCAKPIAFVPDQQAIEQAPALAFSHRAGLHHDLQLCEMNLCEQETKKAEEDRLSGNRIALHSIENYRLCSVVAL
jgi:hypothetical protein